MYTCLPRVRRFSQEEEIIPTIRSEKPYKEIINFKDNFSRSSDIPTRKVSISVKK